MKHLDARVVFFLPVLGGGGAEMHSVRLASGLVEHGIEPVFLVARGPGPYTQFLPSEARVKVLPTGTVNSSMLRLARSIIPLGKAIDELQPDILCPVMPLPSIAAMMAVRRTTWKPRTAILVQNAISRDVFGGNRIVSKLQTTMLPGLWQMSDRIVALSKGVASEITDFFPRLAEKTTVIPNVGMPLPNQMRDGANGHCEREQADETVFIACGRLIEQKGYPFLLQAFVHVSKSRNVRLDVLGVGPMREALESMVIDLHIQDRVRFLGFQNNPLGFIANADIFVLSSLWEGFGNVIVESMAMGTPVVATDCPHGPSEIITSGKDGILVPQGNSQALAEAMLKLTDSPKLRRSMAAAGRKRAKDFSAQKIALTYSALFREMLSNQNSTSNDAISTI